MSEIFETTIQFIDILKACVELEKNSNFPGHDGLISAAEYLNYVPTEDEVKAEQMLEEFVHGLSDRKAKQMLIAMYAGHSISEGDTWAPDELKSMKVICRCLGLSFCPDELIREQLLSKRTDCLLEYLTAYKEAAQF